jgi:hypothetical protein
MTFSSSESYRHQTLARKRPLGTRDYLTNPFKILVRRVTSIIVLAGRKLQIIL